MRSISKILALSCCLLILAATSAMAFGEIRYPDRPLNLRKGRSPNTPWVGSLSPGQKVKVAFLKDGWVAVFEPGETRNSESAAVGYSNVKYLKKEQTRVESKDWGEMVYATRNLNVRNKPSRHGKHVDTLKVNEFVLIDFPEDDWTMVFSPTATIRSKLNGIGYSSSKFFKSASKSSFTKSKPTVESTAVPLTTQPEVGQSSSDSSLWGKGVTITRKINLRRGRTTGSKYIRTLKPGERVRLDYLKNGWYAVFMFHEPSRSEERAMGYALQSLLDNGSEVVDTSSVERKVAPAPKEEPVSPSNPLIKTAPVAVPKVEASALGGTKKAMVIDKAQFKQSKRPDPVPNETAHGYHYRLLEKSETKRFGETWITLKIFLSTTKLPSSPALKDFSTTLWKDHKKVTKKLAVLIYLPGQDTDDLAYGVIQFDDERMLELWVRKATLFGTDFL